MRLGMQGKIVLLYSLLILFAMQLSGVYLVRSLENYYLRNYASSQIAQGELLGSFIRRYLVEEEQQGELISTLIAEFGGNIQGTETMVLDRHGRLLGGPESKSFSLLGERVIQDDILLALSGNRVEAIRADPETGARYYFLALPVKSTSSSVVGVVFLRGSLEHIYLTLKEIKIILITGWLIVLGIAVVIGFLLTRTITAPIREVTSRAAAMAGGDFSQLIEVRSQDEIGELGRMFNFLTARLQETLKEISSEKNKVEAILNYMTDGIIALDREGRAIHLNPAAKQILERSGSSAELGLPGEIILGNLFNSEELSHLLQQTSPSIKEVQAGDEGGKILQVYFAPFKENGSPQGMLVVMHDVTRERKFSRLQQEFVANVSHELRTPLTTIKNYVETLLNGAQDDPGVRLRFLEVVDKETDRMVKLVKDLLVLSQMDYQETNWPKEESDIVSLVREVLEQVELECRAKNIYLHNSLPPGDIAVLINKDKIRQVLLNLLDNAIKYTPNDGRINVSVIIKYDYVWITVKDTGIGIPEEEVERVFDRFFRVDKTRSRDSGGTGLGLSIAKQIVEAHGGSILLKSKLDKGTEVTFSLPLPSI
ncbi:MAG TPA: cell wall metabolism sensor histidine kinase WalK [Firmicutes bacterium]|jgi:two-component system sensor histidine kinase VicK|nr:cell wall metabolism sensor histidine kinase WalK [Bacillota bacterium]